MAARAVIVGVVLIIIIAVANSGSGSKTQATTAVSAANAVTTPSTPAPPPVALKLDTGDYSVTSSHTTLHGTVTAGASVTVEGSQAHVRGTHWSKTVALGIGSNVVNVEASRSGRESSSRTITLTRHHTQGELEAKARARREREQRQKEADERREREEQNENEIENASLSQQNALKAAEKYLEFTAFSEAGLIEQLSSSAGDKYPEQDAVWAVQHLEGVNWDEQAAKGAKKYLEYTSFSCEGLIEQLSSSAGDKYTRAQAEYGARQAGIC